MKQLLKRIGRLIANKKDRVGNLYYLYGIKPIKACKSVIDECTVTRQ